MHTSPSFELLSPSMEEVFSRTCNSLHRKFLPMFFDDDICFTFVMSLHSINAFVDLMCQDQEILQEFQSKNRRKWQKGGVVASLQKKAKSSSA